MKFTQCHTIKTSQGLTLFSGTYRKSCVYQVYQLHVRRNQSSASSCRGFTMTLLQTRHTPPDSSGRMISPTQRPIPDNTQHSQETHSLGP